MISTTLVFFYQAKYFKKRTKNPSHPNKMADAEHAADGAAGPDGVQDLTAMVQTLLQKMVRVGWLQRGRLSNLANHRTTKS